MVTDVIVILLFTASPVGGGPTGRAPTFGTSAAPTFGASAATPPMATPTDPDDAEICPALLADALKDHAASQHKGRQVSTETIRYKPPGYEVSRDGNPQTGRPRHSQ